MTLSRLLIVLFAAVSLPVMAQNLAVVNGKPIRSADADTMIKQLIANGQKDTPDLRERVKEDFITREVFKQEAEKQGIRNTPEVKAQIETAIQSITIRGLIADFLKKNPIADADIKAEYDKFKAQAGDKEYHAKHILVETEAEAKKIIAEIKGGKKFEDLAKQSKDPGSAANGGDLGWATPASFVKPFSDAMVALKKGQMTDTPVQTQFGYHVIKLEDTRPVKMPGLDEVKPQITEALQQKKLQQYQEELRGKAKIS